MTVTANGDTVNYLRGPVPSTAEMVVVVNPDGSSQMGTNAAPGVQRDAVMPASDLTSVAVNINTATTTAIVGATAAQTTRVHRMRLNVAGAQSITVQSGATVLEVLNFTAAGFMVYDFSSRPWYTTAANQALNFVSTTTAQVNGVVEYIKSA